MNRTLVWTLAMVFVLGSSCQNDLLTLAKKGAKRLPSSYPAPSVGPVVDYTYPSATGTSGITMAFDSIGTVYLAAQAVVSNSSPPPATITHWVVRKSDDNMASWSTLDDYSTADSAGALIQNLQVSPTDEVWAVGTTGTYGSGGVIRKLSGPGFGTVFFDTGSVRWLSAMAFDPTGVPYICGQSTGYQGVAYTSSNGGASWSLVDTYGSSVVPNRAFAVGSEIFWTGYFGSYTLVTRLFNGSSWSTSESLSNYVGRGGTRDNGGNAWVVCDYSPTLEIHKFNGSTWTSVFSIAASAIISGGDAVNGTTMAVDPGTGHLFFSGHVHDAATLKYISFVYESTDAGASWTPVETFTLNSAYDTYSSGLVIDGSGRLYECLNATDSSGQHALVRRVL